MRSSCVSTRSRSSFIPWTRFRFGSATSTARRRNSSSAGRANCRVDQPIRIIVHFPESELQSKAAQDLAEAFRRILFPPRDGPAARPHRAVPDWPSFARHRRDRADRVLCHRSPRRRVCREAAQPHDRGEFPDPGLGRELASARNLPVRLVADRPATRSVSPSFRRGCRGPVISGRPIGCGCCRQIGTGRGSAALATYQVDPNQPSSRRLWLLNGSCRFSTHRHAMAPLHSRCTGLWWCW